MGSIVVSSTRPRQQPNAKAQDIDHVFVCGGRATATVLDGNGRSDHNPVRAVVVRDPEQARKT